MSESKRRRISSDEQPSVIQPAVVGSASPTPTVEDNVIVPKLDELAKIVMEDLHKDSVEDVVDALERSWKLFKTIDDTGPKNRKEGVDLGIICALVAILKKWPDNATIQSLACKCLAMLAFADSGAKATVARVGGIEAAVIAMKRFEGLLEVQKCSLWLLLNVLTAGDNAPQTIQVVTKRFVEEFDGIAVAIKAMDTFPNEVNLQEHGCGLFRNISISGKYRDTLLKAGAASAVVKAAEKHLDNQIITKRAAYFMADVFPKSGAWLL